MATPHDADNGDLPSPHEQNPYSSASRWRHQESSAYHRHATHELGHAREPVTTGNTGPLTDFLNAGRTEPDGHVQPGANHQPITIAAAHGLEGEQLDDGRGEVASLDGRQIICGPLLNYRRMDESQWHGSVLVVTKGGGQQVLHQPSLYLRRAGHAGEVAAVNGVEQINGNGASHAHQGLEVQGRRLYSDRRVTFWAFDIVVPLEPEEIKYEYQLPDLRFSSSHKPRINAFFVPAAEESMRIMFHSCNGFSVGTDEDAFSGAPLWNDVLRKHEHAPFHVMVGGGDQIYNDGIRVNGPLRAWTDIGNPKKRREFPFAEKLRAECDDYYLQNYIRWYDSKPFAMANGQIPQINIWDDHDIIDGFGSYVDQFMRCDVFRGIGGTAHKYYMLFQQHMAPPKSTYTSDHLDPDGSEASDPDPNQLVDTFVADPRPDQQYIVGKEPGPYVAEHSYNIYSRLGARIALVGIDARTERTRHQVNYPETYELIFERLRTELREAVVTSRPIKHLILLLGIPIAYPRLTWLENVFRSPIMGPIKFLNRRFGLGGGFFNHFDGSVDLLDDLDDHYTARTHKVERAELITELQDIAAEFSVRVTILGGDVHLAALGRFYSNPKLEIPVEQDSRYMANVISSAIVNKPPPQPVANFLATRNKIHHLNRDTDETLLDLFDKDPGESNKTAGHNHCTMPSRNYATLTENSPNTPSWHADSDEQSAGQNGSSSPSFAGRDGHSELHKGELSAGTKHRAASTETHGRGNDGSLDIAINVEIDQHDPEGKTQGYGLSVPMLQHEPRAA
ncbi:hypothetical protein HIM_07973 [Hirsutella minnesotensis 3608]|uniref:PhoD-like phosphatase domain-containing protein n=1 Tax=Hirsutella minnesotensis 3608 TaxID=1043627 RepID=A0A0F8A3Y0_9HYPO|nr:hypothetical protein HIM_07973 [Hirsutella minnesotensis 3608]